MQKTQQMLYPPLEQGDDDNDDHDLILQHLERGHNSSKQSRTRSYSSLSFASASAASASVSVSSCVLPASLRANFDALEELSPPKRQRCSGSRALAVETAALVSQEVQRMQESITELENLLTVQDEGEVQQQAVGAAVAAVGVHGNVDNNHMIFPALPAVVVVYDNPNHRSQVDTDADNRSNSSNDDDDEVPYTTDE